mgnify:CR=1 FL=1
MSLISSAKSGSSITPIDAGTYAAVCYGMIDLGMQYSEQYNKSSPKVAILWEIPSEQIEVNGEMTSRTLSQIYTNSLGDKASLRRDLAAWRGRDFTETELAAFDLTTIIGAPCMINVIHKDVGGKTYANIGAIMKMPKGMAPPTGTLEHIIFDLDSDDLSIINTLPKWLADKIKESETYKERIAGTGDMAGDEESDVDVDGYMNGLMQEIEDSDEELPF